MKNIIKMLLPAVLVAVGLVYTSYLENETNNGLQRQLDVIANHEHVHEHDTSHKHDTTHEHPEIRAMLELMFELENKVNAK
tara:strand:- start:61 stop:303 length:243 start_codon:yes stop_codon:yes gene_type:complete